MRVESASRLRLAGCLDVATREFLEAVLDELTAPTLCVDVHELTFADAAGLAPLAREDARRRAGSRGQVKIVRSSAQLRTILRAAGLDRLLPWHQGREGEDWRQHAACRQLSTTLFFDVGYADQAKQACWSCPSIGPCLRFALRTEQQFGVWGGLTPGERHRLLA